MHYGAKKTGLFLIQAYFMFFQAKLDVMGEKNHFSTFFEN